MYLTDLKPDSSDICERTYKVFHIILSLKRWLILYYLVSKFFDVFLYISNYSICLGIATRQGELLEISLDSRSVFDNSKQSSIEDSLLYSDVRFPNKFTVFLLHKRRYFSNVYH